MAKFVGKIFRVSNSTLKLHGNDTHYVSVKWYNPFNHKFKCRVITSLEKRVDKTALSGEAAKVACSVYDAKTKTHFLLGKNKYKQIRNGTIEPIPITQCENFEVWSGYSKTVYLTKNDLKNKANLKIKKQG